jgi:hypothetical protein
MGNSTAREFARSDPTVFSSKQLEKDLKRDIINPITKYTADIATIPIKAAKKSMKPIKLSEAMKRDIMNGSKTKKTKK